MAVAKRSAPSVRPRYVLAVVAIGTGLAASGGCKHHRYGAMRPKFVGPATVVPVEPFPAPGITAPAFEDEAVTPPSLLAPADPAARPGLRKAPRLEPSPADPAARPGLREAPRLEPSPADPAARPGLREGPRLEPSPADPAAPAAEPDENDGLMLETPGTSRRGTQPAAPVTRQATLRTRLTRYVNDPDDLFQPPKADRSWRYIVLHHSAQPEGGYPEIDREHRARLGRRGAAITSSSATGRVARTARSRSPGAGATARGCSLPRRQDAGRQRLRHRHLPGGQPRPGRPDAEADRGRPVAGRVPSVELQHPGPERGRPRPARPEPHRLPRQAFPSPGDPRRRQGDPGPPLRGEVGAGSPITQMLILCFGEMARGAIRPVNRGNTGRKVNSL